MPSLKFNDEINRHVKSYYEMKFNQGYDALNSAFSALIEFRNAYLVAYNYADFNDKMALNDDIANYKYSKEHNLKNAVHLERRGDTIHTTKLVPTQKGMTVEELGNDIKERMNNDKKGLYNKLGNQIAVYAAYKDKLERRSFWSKLFHPIRTYKENQARTEMETTLVSHGFNLKELKDYSNEFIAIQKRPFPHNHDENKVVENEDILIKNDDINVQPEKNIDSIEAFNKDIIIDTQEKQVNKKLSTKKTIKDKTLEKEANVNIDVIKLDD